MRKSLTIYTLLFAFLACSFNVNASFPVKKAKKTMEVVKHNKIEKKEITTFAAVVNSEKSQIAAILLCLLVGVIGIHRFYLGYTWQGVLQILTFGAFGIWTLIDLVRIVTGELQPKNGSYSKTL